MKGTSIAFPKERRSFVNLASVTCNEFNINGLIGAIVPRAEYLVILTDQNDERNTVAQLLALATGTVIQTVGTGIFEFLDPPLARPVPTNPVTTLSIATHKMELSLWEHNRDLFTKQFTGLKILKDAMIQALDPVSLAELDDPDYGFQKLTPALILQHLDNRFKIATASDLQSNRAILTVPFRADQDFLMFVQTQRAAHTYAERAQHPIDSAEQVAYFKQALVPCGLFTQKMFLYFAMHDMVSQQSFAAFSDSMSQEWKTQILPARANVTVSSFAGAAAVVLSDADRIAKLEATIESFRSANATSTTRATVAKTSVSDVKKPRTFTHYCWTHGTYCNHTSEECFDHKRKPGHRIDATFTDQMEGNPNKFVPYVRPKKAASSSTA